MKRTFVFLFLVPLLWVSAPALAQKPEVNNSPTYRFAVGGSEGFVVESWSSKTEHYNGEPIWLHRNGKAEQITPHFYGLVRNTIYRVRRLSGQLPAGVQIEEILTAYPSDKRSSGAEIVPVEDGLASDLYIWPAKSKWRVVNQELFLVYGKTKIQFAQLRLEVGDGEIDVTPQNSKIEDGVSGTKLITFLPPSE